MTRRILKAGDFDQRVTVQQLTTGHDAFGAPTSTWIDVCIVWAKVADMSGREYLAAAAAQAEVTTKITIRYRAGLTAAMRVLHGGNVYNIQAVLTQDKVVCTLMCTRGVNNG